MQFWKSLWNRTDRTSSTHASVRTDRPARYGKQLVAHMGRRFGGEWSADQESGWIQLGRDGRATVTAAEGSLEVVLTGPAGQLPTMEHSVGSHLMRFGERDELRVEWVRAE